MRIQRVLFVVHLVFIAAVLAAALGIGMAQR